MHRRRDPESIIMDSNSIGLGANVDLGLIADNRNLRSLKKLAHGSNAEKALALKTAAQQFESLLMQQWVDAMRKTNEELNPDSPLHSKYSTFYQDMLSQQQVQAMVNNGGRLNRNSITYMIAKQFASSLGDEGKAMLEELEKGTTPRRLSEGLPMGRATEQALASAGTTGTTPSTDMSTRYKGRTPKTGLGSLIQPTTAQASVRSLREDFAVEELTPLEDMKGFSGPEDFVQKLMPYAVKAAEDSGMNPLVMVAQAALETGWGDHVPANNNYFGIKAGKSWQGESMSLNSPEYEDGRMVTRTSRFRSYDSVLESMKDYIKLIKENDRYAEAADKSFDPDNYFNEIQKAGYATDPHYARKLKNIAQRIAFMAYK